MIDPQLFIDRMLEVENLTDSLEDDDADYLINWGVAQLRENVTKSEDIDFAGEYTNDLMGFMRSLNRIMGDPDSVTTDDLVQLAERRQKVFGPERELAPNEFQEAAAHLTGLTPQQAMDFLLQWFLPVDSPLTPDSRPVDGETSSMEDKSTE